MPLNLITDVFKAERENKEGKVPYGFLVIVIAVPIIVASILLCKDVLLTKESIGTLINVLAIFVGFLIAALVPYFEIAAAALDGVEKKPTDDFDVQNRRKLFKIIFPSIIFSIVMSLMGLIFLILLSLLFKKEFLYKEYFVMTVNWVAYFSIFSNFFNIINLTRRTSTLVIPILKDTID